MEFDKIAPNPTMDQAMEGLKTTAASMAEYFHSLRKGGFSRKEAFTLTMSMQTILFNNARNQS